MCTANISYDDGKTLLFLLGDILPWFSKEHSVHLTRLADCWSVDDRHECFNVPGQHTIEQFLITILEVNQVQIFVQVILNPLYIKHGRHSSSICDYKKYRKIKFYHKVYINNIGT